MGAGPAVDPRADRIEKLRRCMDAIPARSAGPPRLTPVEPAAPDPARSTPSSLRTLPLPAPLAQLLPHGGLVRGSVVQIAGAASLKAGLIASVTGAGGWAAVVGCPDLGLLAAAEMGADLSRCAVIPNPGEDPVAIAAVLVDGLDLVVLSLGDFNAPPSRVRAVTARARRNGTVLVVDGQWPNVDLRLSAKVSRYQGLGRAHGRVTGIGLDVEATPRGQLPRRTQVTVSGIPGAAVWANADAEIPASQRGLSLRIAQ